MKTSLLLLAFALFTASVATAAPPDATAPSTAPAATATVDHAAEAALAKLFSDHKPVHRTDGCFDAVYEDCLSFCSELSQNGGCTFFAEQQCLCERFPADCPVCY
ncbi:MAG TPA: hypothetical protein VMM92_10560 [Thermoanaerobaculia bacterium]|nr:hypothetical protein [Thermoanaerobaculia bacterium]